MRGKLGVLCVFLGMFLIVVAVLAQTWASNALKRTPIDIDTTTHLAGGATINGETFPVRATSVTKSDSEASTDSTVVFTTSSCLVKDEPGVPDCVSDDDPSGALVSASLDDFATDRVTAEAVNDPDLLPPSAVPHEGIVNKFPFDVEKRTYPYWTGMLGRAVDAEFIEADEVAGVEVYHFQVSIVDEAAEVGGGIMGLYSETIDIYVEPNTGSILNQETSQDRRTTDGKPILEASLAFTEEQSTSNAGDAEDNISKLRLLTETVPLIGYAVGIPLLLIGLILRFLGRRAKREEPNAGADVLVSA